MVPFFPHQVANRALLTYGVSVALVSMVFFSHSMSLMYIALGFVFVAGFFNLTSVWSVRWKRMNEDQFVKILFGLALGLRLVWVVASYYYYIETTGTEFDKDARDATGYHYQASWFYYLPWEEIFDRCFGAKAVGISDAGYPLYLTMIYKMFGIHVMVPRIIKAFIGAWTAVLIYKISARTFEESTGRMAGLMCALMPNMIIYCGYHLKEIEMIFLEVAFLERMDYLLRIRKYNFLNIMVPILLAGILFFFRTVLGLAAVFAFATSTLFSVSPTMRRGWKRTAIIGWSVLALVLATGGTAVTEVEELWENKSSNVERKRMEQTGQGNQWAHYATGTVMAPMIVALPFSTMIDVEGQENQMTKHGGNFVRNFMAFFAILAIYEAIRQKKWRDFSLIGSFTVAYLGVISISGFSNSERFLLPGLAGLIPMWAYGVSQLNAKNYRMMHYWFYVVVVMEVGWAYFKLGSRGLF